MIITVGNQEGLPSHEEVDKFLAVMKAADKAKPKREDVAELQHYLAKYPALCKAVGDMGALALMRLCETLGAQKGFTLSVQTRAEQLAGELAGRDPSPLVVLLAEQAALCWANFYDTQYRWANVHGAESVTLERSEYWDRRLDRAQRRYLRALEALAKARRLALPALQVNIAQQQVNQLTPAK